MTCFATFGGTLEAQLSQIFGNERILFTEKETALEIRDQIDKAVTHFETEPNNLRQLSCDCYALLLQFSNGFSTPTPAILRGKIRPARASADRNTLHGGSDRRTALPQRLCIPSICLACLCAILGARSMNI